MILGDALGDPGSVASQLTGGQKRPACILVETTQSPAATPIGSGEDGAEPSRTPGRPMCSAAQRSNDAEPAVTMQKTAHRGGSSTDQALCTEYRRAETGGCWNRNRKNKFFTAT